MNAVTSRIASGLVLLAAPVMIALGTATISHADTTSSASGAATSISHPAFPHQSNMPQPGTAVHHHHQNHK